MIQFLAWSENPPLLGKCFRESAIIKLFLITSSSHLATVSDTSDTTGGKSYILTKPFVSLTQVLAGIYLFKVNNDGTITMCETYSWLTTKKPKRSQVS